MLFRTKFLASAALISFAANFAHADAHAEMTAETVVATVDGTEITLGHLIILRAQLPDQYLRLPDDVVFNGLVEQIVNQQLLGNTLEVEPRRVAIAVENETRSMRAGEVVNTFTTATVSEEDIQAAYDARFAGVEPEAEYNASHILVETEEEALEIKGMITDGADFADTAREKSTGPSGPSGGELGWFGLGMMVPSFEEAVLTLDAGEVSAPVQTQFGWHVVKLNETRETPLPTLEELRRELGEEIQQAGLSALIEELTEAADLSLPEAGQFDYAIIKNLDLLEE